MSVRPAWVITAVVATVVSMQCFARTQRRMLHAADPGARATVTLARMVGVTYAANALNMTLPAGGPVSAAYMIKRFRDWGSTSVAATFTVVASGVLSSVTFFALVIGCGLAAGRFGASGAGTYLLAIAASVVAVGAVVVRRDCDPAGRLRRVLGRLERRLRRISDRGADALHDAVEGLVAVHPRRRDWLAGAGVAAANWLADFGCLAASGRATGLSDVDPVVLLSAYLAGMLASSMAFVPGGFGVIEVAMVATLHSGGVATAPAAAAVFLYRMISCVGVVAAGWVVWFRRAARAGRRPFRRWSARRSGRHLDGVLDAPQLWP